MTSKYMIATVAMLLCQDMAHAVTATIKCGDEKGTPEKTYIFSDHDLIAAVKGAIAKVEKDRLEEDVLYQDLQCTSIKVTPMTCSLSHCDTKHCRPQPPCRW